MSFLDIGKRLKIKKIKLKDIPAPILNFLKKDIYCSGSKLMKFDRKDEEESPFLCAVCGLPFNPSDWQNDICDKCLYKK